MALTPTAVIAVEVAGIRISDRLSMGSGPTRVAGPPREALCLAVRDTEIFTVSTCGTVSATDLGTGKVRWTSKLDRPVHAAAVAAWGDRALVASTHDGGSLDLSWVARDDSTPQAHQTHPARGTPLDVLALPGDAGAVVTTTGAVCTVHSDLTLRWGRRWTVHSNIVPSPTHEAILLLADDSLLALSVAKGTKLWSRPVLGRKSHRAVGFHGGVVVASEITAAAFTWSGSVVWVRSLRDRIVAGPVAVGPDLVAVVDRGGELHLLRTADGTVAGAWALGDRAVTDVLADADLLVMVGPDPGLVCIPADQLLATVRIAEGV